jgi:hypothetical protein
MRITLAGALLAASCVVASAQPAPTVRVKGTIEKVDGNVLTLKTAAGEEKLTLTGNAQVVAVLKASMADIKENTFLGSAAMPQPDGSQKALEVHIFPEAMRGTGEGHRPWTRPNTTMTNATVDTTVSGVDGQNIMVKYKDGEKKIVIGPDAVIRQYVAGDKSELKPGAHVGINATKQPDGSLQTARVNVGRGDVIPD